ncbi:hypothetical protein B0H17DRAFT_1092339 [Mycena rosella]|uniref:Annexin n=1 Tax=Mycena rosella TaxID=1033263 RepID=A0AAD7CUW5_MYCRO|nr:hypothetical protein B0H17DRAFT_1092339 [Mycena rosella]
MSDPPQHPQASGPYPGGYPQVPPPGGYAQPPPGGYAQASAGGFAIPGQAPYPMPGAPGGQPGYAPHYINPAPGAPPMPSYPEYAPPVFPAAGYLPPSGPPPGQSPYGAPQQSYPGYLPAAGTPGAPMYAPPPVAVGVPGAPVPGMPTPAGTTAQTGSYLTPTVLYRGIVIHNPRLTAPSMEGYYPQGEQDKQLEADIADITKAGSSEKKLIQVLTRLGPLKMEIVASRFKGTGLANLVGAKTSGYVEKGLLGLVLGPLQYDVELVHDAVKGMGTNEQILNEVILDLTPQEKYSTEPELSARVRQDLTGMLGGSTSVSLLFEKALDPTRRFLPNATVDETLHLKKEEHECDRFYEVLTGRHHEHLILVLWRWLNSLMWIVRGAEENARYKKKQKNTPPEETDPRIMRDTEMLEETMAGMGTKDSLLLMRVLRAHWSRPRMDSISKAYLHMYEKKLEKRIKGETSGAFEDLLLALIEGPPPPTAVMPTPGY